MQSNRSLVGGLLAVFLAAAAAPAVASDDCNVPAERWQSRDALMQMAQRQGWQVQRVKVDDGCYEIVGKESSGRAFKAKVDPQTLDVVKMKTRDRHRSDPQGQPATGAPRS